MSISTTSALQQNMVQYAADRPIVESSDDNSSTPEELTAEESIEPRFVHPDAMTMFRACPWTRYIPVFGKACEAFGPKCVSSLGISYFLCKGIADQMISYARYPMFRNRYGIDGVRYQRLANIATMGWSIKAFTAMLCDAFACFGYTKRWYMLVSCVVGAVFALIYGFLPAKESSADIAAAFVFLCSYGKANVDILSEGFYSRLMRQNPKAGPSLVSWIWWFIMIGSIVAAGIQGPLSDQGKMRDGVFISAALQFVTGVIYIFNWYGEKTNRVSRAEDARILHEEMLRERANLGLQSANANEDVMGVDPVKDLHPEKFHESDEEGEEGESREQRMNTALTDDLVSQSPVVAKEVVDDDFEPPQPISCLCGIFEFNKEVAVRNWKIFIYSGVMTCAVIAMTCADILADTLGLLIISVVVSVVCCGCSFWALPLVIAKANVFGYLQQVVYIQLPGALDSFYMADKECLPDGPHFSYTFYNTIAAVIGNAAGLIGVTAFTYIFSKHSYRLTFVITTIVQVIASVFDIIIVKRWNIYIGIPDHAMYICGDAVVYQVCYMLAWMPMVVLLSRLCPRGSESVVYALMAGFSNLGQSMSAAIGSIIMEYGWHVVTEGNCDFSNVPWLLLVGHILCPLLVIPLCFLLIPAARICDDLDVDGKAIKEEMKKNTMREQEATDLHDKVVATNAAEPFSAVVASELGSASVSDFRFLDDDS